MVPNRATHHKYFFNLLNSSIPSQCPIDFDIISYHLENHTHLHLELRAMCHLQACIYYSVNTSERLLYNIFEKFHDRDVLRRFIVSLINCVPCLLKTCSQANVPCVLTSQRVLRVHVPLCLESLTSHGLRDHVITCQHALPHQ